MVALHLSGICPDQLPGSLDSLVFENSVYYSERQIKDYQNRQHYWKQNEKICSRCLSAAGNPILRLLAICP